jgi:D-sedoheptulose 7-phosphate isomerase
MASGTGPGDGEAGEDIVSDYSARYLKEAAEICSRIDQGQVEKMIDVLLETRKAGGRLFFLGVGGGAGNASHAVNDFRKIADIESYAPTDNVSELTARVNDDGWETSFAVWLQGSRIRKGDAVFVFSVGGGNREKNVSMNIVRALELARSQGASVLGVVGRDGGYTAQVADAVVIIPTLSADTVTPHAEAFQAVVWHLIVSHPRLKANEMKWESTDLSGSRPRFSNQ